MKQYKTKNISVRITEEEHSLLKEQAKKNDKTVSEYIREKIFKEVNENE